MNTRVASDFEVIPFNPVTRDIEPLENNILPNKGTKFAVDSDITLEQDGATIECTIAPQDTPEKFSNSIKNALESILYYTNYKYSTLASYQFKGLKGAQAELGCSPSVSAWTGTPRRAIALTNNPYFRTAGGHLHIDISEEFKGDDDAHYNEVIRIAKNLDLFLGLPSLLLDPDESRRKLYGFSGDIRIKEYGLEYRTLSNFWIFNPILRKYVYNQVQEAIKFNQEISTDVPRSIDTGNHDKARDILDSFNLLDEVDSINYYLRGEQ